MSVTTELNEYSIFNDVESYIKKAKAVESEVNKSKLSKECNYFLSRATYSNIKLSILCEQFKYMYNKLTSVKENKKTHKTYNDDCAYLNYWLNDKLKSIDINSSVPVEKFLRKIKEYDKNFDKDNFFLGKIYDLNDDVLENMRILHNLYDKYYKIHDMLDGKSKIEAESCLSHFVECVYEYKYAKIKCFMNNNNLCEVLKVFKDNYSQFDLMDSKLNKCNINEVIKLPTDEEILIMYKNILKNVKNEKLSTIAVVGPSLGLFSILTLFYKFTPFGSWIRTKMNGANRTYSNIDEIKNNMSLIPIDKEYRSTDNNRYNISYSSA